MEYYMQHTVYKKGNVTFMYNSFRTSCLHHSTHWSPSGSFNVVEYVLCQQNGSIMQTTVHRALILHPTMFFDDQLSLCFSTIYCAVKWGIHFYSAVLQC